MFDFSSITRNTVRTAALALCIALAICATLVKTVAAAPYEDTMAQRTLACTGCHGDQGRAGPDGYYPRLAGKPVEYLYNQLISFKEGRRHYAPMERLISTLDDRYLREMAQYFSALALPYASPAARALTTGAADTQAAATKASQLVHLGDATRGLPACAQCHGKALTGTEPNIPGLLGLPADYLLAQLGGWQNHRRRALEPDCMGKVANMLQPADISALAQWLSSQTVPTSAKPAPQLPPHQTGLVDIATPAWRCVPSANQAVAAPEIRSAQVVRGEYLARIGNCAQCHTAQGGAPYAGGRSIDTPFGTVVSGNLTPDVHYGIGNWSAQDFWRALHEGKSKSGRALYPAFPYTSYTRVSRDDADALFAYLKTLPASSTPNQPHGLRWPYSTQLALQLWRLLFFRPATDTDTTTDRGAYLVQGLGHCDECHSPRNRLGVLDKDASADSVLPVIQWVAPSLHSRWLLSWSDGQLQTFLQTGTSPKGYAAGPMAEVVQHGTRYLTDADAAAMARFLKARAADAPASTTDRKNSANPADASAVTLTVSKGAAIYDAQCAGCHGKMGRGQPGAYPPLAGNPNVQRPNINNLVLQVLYGGYPASTEGNPRPFGMPPYVLTLNDADIAAVLTFIRTSWGNQGARVSEFDINKLRIALARTP